MYCFSSTKTNMERHLLVLSSDAPCTFFMKISGLRPCNWMTYVYVSLSSIPLMVGTSTATYFSRDLSVTAVCISFAAPSHLKGYGMIKYLKHTLFCNRDILCLGLAYVGLCSHCAARKAGSTVAAGPESTSN